MQRQQPGGVGLQQVRGQHRLRRQRAVERVGHRGHQCLRPRQQLGKGQGPGLLAGQQQQRGLGDGIAGLQVAAAGRAGDLDAQRAQIGGG
jgi:hypothetical protein